MLEKIYPANKRTIFDSPQLPDVTEAIMHFFQPLKIEIVFKKNNSGYLKEKHKCILTQGVRQTMTPVQLAIKPEGERSWKWSRLHTIPIPGNPLETDDVVEIRGVKYRVMSVTDQAEYGFTEYDLLEDYEHEN